MPGVGDGSNDPPEQAHREEQASRPEDAGTGAGTGAADGVRGQLRRLENLIEPGVRGIETASEHVLLPAWRRATEGEPRWPVAATILLAVALQLALPGHLGFHPIWVLPALEGVLLSALLADDPKKHTHESPRRRALSMALIVTISLANAWSAGRLVLGLIEGRNHQDAQGLLMSGGAIWLTNVIVFALWYWQLDRGGPVARAHGDDPYPDFVFPQMTTPELAPPKWEPGFADYLYLSFTNATAFSPTDVMPFSRWAKMTMMLQSAVSLATVALVVARAVNILK